MSLVLRRSYIIAKEYFILSSQNSKSHLPICISTTFHRTFSDDKNNTPDFSSSTILVENGFNVQELPVVIRRLTDISEAKEYDTSAKPAKYAADSLNYQLIQTEFKECADLKDVFSLLSKCTKITPNIALGAMERIYDLDKEPHTALVLKGDHIYLAKGAILDKLLKVVMKTEDTQTILNVLQSNSTLMAPYKYKFCDELMFRAIDNKMSVEQICVFTDFLIKNKGEPKYAETIDKLWVGFVERESDINETNIVFVFNILPGLKVSKRIVLTLLEQKLSDLWYKIDVPIMQDVLSSFVEEKYLSLETFSLVGRWLNTNIHSLDEDALLDIVSKITRLQYTDDQIEKAVERYMRLKGTKISSHVLIVGILNYCMQFQIRNVHILNTCSDYFVRQGHIVPPSFLKSYIYPFGYLHFYPQNKSNFWVLAENIILDQINRIKIDDLCMLILSFIYLGKYPIKVVNKMFSAENLSKVYDSEVWKKLHLIDTALSLECDTYAGPLLPKDQWSKPVIPDIRIKNIVAKIYDSLVSVAGGENKLSKDVMVPHFSDRTYLIDVMLHPAGLQEHIHNWKKKSTRNENTAILLHLPDHYCSDNNELIGPQKMRKKHLKILGLKVVSVKYSVISKFYTSYDTKGLRQYLIDSINNAERSV